jgi:very-short-patch-repair endonuclease
MEKRRIVCGNPYSFQGDQRDVIFLSMVAASNERIGAFTKIADERRFNVAASRARDQMWLFHSVRRDDLSESCLRRKLLAFFETTAQNESSKLKIEELERKAFQDNRLIVNPPQPFDSWFELDVALELLRRRYDIIPQYAVAGKRIDLVVEGGKARLAVECYGDKWHGPEQFEKDSQRQRKLERCGWEFYIIRECDFYANGEVAMQRLWPLLEERGIFPNWFEKSMAVDAKVVEEEIDPSFEEAEDADDEELSLFENIGNKPSRRLEEIPTIDISNAIIHALDKCPNYSCTLHSLTSRVLRELSVITRGKPRMEFEKRVMRSLAILENKEQIEKYRAKNKRIRLITK